MPKYKILLINPPIKPKNPPYNLPLGLACIAAIIESKGHDVAIFDNNAYRLPINQILDQISDVNWDMICIGNLVTTYNWQKQMFSKLREKFPNAILQAGGGLATSLQSQLMEWIPEIDILVIGEGERTEGQIIDNFAERSWERVNGIIYRKGKNLFKTPPQKLLSEEELSKLPFPKFDLLPLDEVYFKYSSIPLSPEAMVCKRRISIEASRGCPFPCSFCIDLPSGTPRDKKNNPNEIIGNNETSQKKMRYYNPERVVEHIKFLRLKYAIDFVCFSDENFTVNRSKVIQFCDLMEREGLVDLDPPLYFGTTAHVNTIDPEMLQRLKTVGCCALDLGLESMNKDILKGIRKNATPEKNLWAFKECLKVGIYPVTNFMVGLPNETAQSIYDSTKFFIDYNIECGPFFSTPYPLTGLFEQNKNKILEEYGNLENYIKECEVDVSADLIINLTQYNDAELLGLRQMMINHDLKAIKKFAGQKEELIIE